MDPKINIDMEREVKPRLQKRLQKARAESYDGPRPLTTVEAKRRGQSAMETLPIREYSPWVMYSIIYKLVLGVNAPKFVSERRGISFDVVDIRPVKPLSTFQTKMLESIQHPNFLTIHEIYQSFGKSYIVSEHAPRSLAEAVGNPYLNDLRLASIIGQIVEALSFIEKKNLSHGNLSCSNVFLLPNGKIKLCGQENCTPSKVSGDIKDLSLIMMELMEGYVKEGTNVGLDDPDRWHPDALNFLSTTVTCDSATELLQHRFLSSKRPDALKGFASLVMTWTKPKYEYVGWQSSE